MASESDLGSKRKRILLASSSLLALPTLQVLQTRSDLDLRGILTTPDKAKGRSGTPTPNELVQALTSYSLPIYKPEDEFALLELIDRIKPDLVMVIAYGRMIRRTALERVPLGWFNLHFSLLPRYRGAAPVQRALLDGGNDFGVTIFRIDEGMDTGPIFEQKSMEFSEESSATQILERLAVEGAGLIPALLTRIDRGDHGMAQQGPHSMAPKITKEQCRLNLDMDDEKVFNQLRALTERPGVWFLLNGRRHIITEARPTLEQVPLGYLSIRGGRALIGTSGRAVEVVTVVPEGKRRMSGVEWLRGRKLREGETSEDGIDR